VCLCLSHAAFVPLRNRQPVIATCCPSHNNPPGTETYSRLSPTPHYSTPRKSTPRSGPRESTPHSHHYQPAPLDLAPSCTYLPMAGLSPISCPHVRYHLALVTFILTFVVIPPFLALHPLSVGHTHEIPFIPTLPRSSPSSPLCWCRMSSPCCRRRICLRSVFRRRICLRCVERRRMNMYSCTIYVL
jgi:hypothetical protein